MQAIFVVGGMAALGAWLMRRGSQPPHAYEDRTWLGLSPWHGMMRKQRRGHCG
jgi:hypothetical protein